MKTLIGIVGAFVILMGLLILAVPDRFRELMNRWQGQGRFLFAIIVRIVFGAIVLTISTELRYPFVMQIIGGISIVAAIVILLIGPERLDHFIGWWMRMPDNVLRISAVFAMAFGAFLIYVVT